MTGQETTSNFIYSSKIVNDSILLCDGDESIEGISLDDSSKFPDGGLHAWLCVAGGAACFFCSFGWVNCIGVFQDYYEHELLRSYNPSTIGWISSLEIFCMLFFAPVCGKLFDNYGPRYLLLMGTLLHVFGLILASFSTKYYQFLLSQGLCSGIGASMIFNSATSSTATWFHRRRGLAMGCVAGGSGLGGVIFPIVVNQLIPKIGFGWAMRICAIIILSLMGFAILTVSSRLVPSKQPFTLVDFIGPLREPAFLSTTLATFFFYYGLFVPLSFIVSDARSHGMPIHLAQYLVSMINAGSIFGRTLPGYIGDRIGRFNTMILFCTVTGISILALWIPANNNATIIAFCCILGFASGAAVGLTPVLVAQISDMKEIGLRTGTVWGITSFAALTGTPIGGALVQQHSQPGNLAGYGLPEGYIHMKIFSGVFCLVGVIFFVIARLHLGQWSWKVTVKI